MRRKPNPLTLDDFAELLNEASVFVASSSVAGEVIHALRRAAVRIVDQRNRSAADVEARILARAEELMAQRQPHQLHALTWSDCYVVARMEITGKASE